MPDHQPAGPDSPEFRAVRIFLDPLGENFYIGVFQIQEIQYVGISED